MGAPNPDVTALVQNLALQHWTTANTPDLTGVIAAVTAQLSRLGGEINAPLVAFANAQLDALFAAQEALESIHGGSGPFGPIAAFGNIVFQGETGAIVGIGTAAGIIGVGGPNARGLQGNGGPPNGTGVRAIGQGTGLGVQATSVSGTAVDAFSASGYALVTTGNATRGNIRMVPRTPAPTTPLEGDMYYDSATHHFFGWTGAAWIQLDN